MALKQKSVTIRGGRDVSNDPPRPQKYPKAKTSTPPPQDEPSAGDIDNIES